MKVLGDGGRERGKGAVLGVRRAEVRLTMLQRETDGNESVNGKRHADPDGSVAARVEHELLQFTEMLIQLLEDDLEQRLDPLGDHAANKDAQVGTCHPTQVDARRRASHAAL